MGKKHKHPEHENLERWLVSYADFITLLFATFVVLYALSQADLAKFKEVSAAIKQAFNPAKSVMENPGGIMKGTPDAKILKDSGNSILDKVIPKFPENAQEHGSLEPITKAIQAINSDIQKMNVKAGFKGEESISQTTLKVQERGIVISFASSLFFEPGSAGLKPQAYSVLSTVRDALAKEKRIVHVEGHTDSLPITTAVYPSNWELSSARASSVVRFLLSGKQLSPSTLAAVGYGSSRPIASNATPEGRQKNRRVDIVILFSSAANLADAGQAQKTEHIVLSEESEGVGGSSSKTVSKPMPATKPKAIPLPTKEVDITPRKPTIFVPH